MILGPTNCWVKKKFGSNKIFGPQQFWTKKNFSSKKF